MITPFAAESTPPVKGFLHQPGKPSGDALVITHGAGSNCNAPLLVALAEVFTDKGFVVLRCDLPYRQKRPHGSPFRGDAANDREGLRRAVEAVKNLAPHPSWILLGGHSYGGRQASMLAAESPELATGLLLTSYPLHPPNQPGALRTGHFPALRVPALFVHGTRDPFASTEEIEAALKVIPAPTSILHLEGAGHDLLGGGKRDRAERVREIGTRIRDTGLLFWGDRSAKAAAVTS